MILYITVAAVTALLAGMVNCRPAIQPYRMTRQQMCNRICLFTVFLILFALSACRLNVGNDYAKYVEFMHLVNCNAYVPTEVGFNLLVKLLYGLSGYENYLLVFAVYAFTTVGIFLLAMYEQSEDFPLTFFLFMALGYYFQTFSTVRYYLALALALYSMKFVLRGQWVRFILLILLGAAFHKSLLVVIPLYILAVLPWKKWQLAVGALFCTTFILCQDFYLKLVIMLYPTYEDTEYLEGGTSYINIMRCMAVLILAGIVYLAQKYEKKACREASRTRCAERTRVMQLVFDSGDPGSCSKEMHFYFYLNLGALVLYVFCSFLPIISRIGYYLTVSHILYLPALLKRVENERQRKALRAGILMAAVLYFAVYMGRADNDGTLILPYKTFFFHDMVNILSDVN
ncbi:MAG: EpsG family protein [Lachnospiraceae bacterium]|nr:EpsG family protein [Lachnospiraceae bacterium]